MKWSIYPVMACLASVWGARKEWTSPTGMVGEERYEDGGKGKTPLGQGWLGVSPILPGCC